MAEYYEILGVPRDAAEKDIRQAYRKLAREHHPDVNFGDEASQDRFKQINEAYSVLSDPEKRTRYDKYGDNWVHSDQIEEAQARARSGGRFRWNDLSGEDPFSTFDRGGGGLFDQFFGGFQGNLGRTATEHPVEVTLEEAYHGTTRRLQLRGGRRLEVKIPPGVDTGSRIHVSPDGGSQVDLYLVVTVRFHRDFQREGGDLYSQVDVPLEDAVLGGDVTVPTLRGRLSLNIPPDTQNGQRFRLAGQGMPELNNSSVNGDPYTTVNVRLPTDLSPEERELFQKLRESLASKRR